MLVNKRINILATTQPKMCVWIRAAKLDNPLQLSANSMCACVCVCLIRLKQQSVGKSDYIAIRTSIDFSFVAVAIQEEIGFSV